MRLVVTAGPTREAIDGEIVKAGHIYLAPGGLHMRVARHGADVVIALDNGPPINFCKPAVDPLFSSAIDVWQAGVLAVYRAVLSELPRITLQV